MNYKGGIVIFRFLYVGINQYSSLYALINGYKYYL
jgi:hypothetical protein